MLNVGPLELLVVLAVALIVVGPERLPDLARSVGRALRQFREVQDEVRGMVSSSVDDDMREVASEFKKAAGGVKRATDVKGAVRRTVREQTDTSTTPRTQKSPPGREAEPGGAPADRLVEDAGEATPPTAAPEPSTPPSPNGERGSEDRPTP